MGHCRVNPNLQHKLGQSVTAFYVTNKKGDLNGHCNASAQEPISSSWPRPISRVVNLKRLLLLLAPFNLGAEVQSPRSGHARCQIVWCWSSGVTRRFVEFTKWPASWLKAVLCENLYLGIPWASPSYMNPRPCSLSGTQIPGCLLPLFSSIFNEHLRNLSYLTVWNGTAQALFRQEPTSSKLTYECTWKRLCY